MRRLVFGKEENLWGGLKSFKRKVGDGTGGGGQGKRSTSLSC